MRSTRTSSPYFSPNSAIAPARDRVVVVHQARLDRGVGADLARSPAARSRAAASGVTAAKCEKSKRSRSGATSEPFCVTWSPSTLRSAACSRCVAEWLSAVAWRSARSTSRRARASPTRERAALEPRRRAGAPRRASACPSRRSARRPRLEHAAVADLAAALGVERRAVEHHLRPPRPRAARSTAAPSRNSATTSPARRARCRSR